jgi:nucleotide-binding universal stress UspA family protein
MQRKVILVPSDFTAAAKTALKTAIELAEEGGVVEVVHVFQPSPYTTPAQTTGARAEVTEALGEIAKRNAKARVTVRVKLLDGSSVAEALVKHAEKIKADVIVMPTHGRKGLTRALLGSVTERVVRLAGCAVLTLPVY